MASKADRWDQPAFQQTNPYPDPGPTYTGLRDNFTNGRDTEAYNRIDERLSKALRAIDTITGDPTRYNKYDRLKAHGASIRQHREALRLQCIAADGYYKENLNNEEYIRNALTELHIISGELPSIRVLAQEIKNNMTMLQKLEHWKQKYPELWVALQVLLKVVSLGVV
jgi:hypothetical protein